jgi:transposase
MKSRQGAIHVQEVRKSHKGKAYSNFYLRQSVREGKKVHKVTLGNLSSLPLEIIHLIRRSLKGDALMAPCDVFEIIRTVPHGATAAVYGTVRQLGLEAMLASRGSRERDVAMAMVVARVLDPASKLATARAFQGETAWISLGERLGLEDVQVRELYGAMDWLWERKAMIEAKLAAVHLREGSLVLYDVTAAVLDSRTCELAQIGHSKGGARGKRQIVFGLLCSREGCPVGVEVFKGNTGDPKTLARQIEKVREQFGVNRVVWVGDRGLITEARIREELKDVEGFSWITALRSPAIRTLVEQNAVQMSLFDRRDLVEIAHPDYPGERLIVCRNPLLAGERERKRQDLIAATEKELDKIVAATGRARGRLKGKAAIGMKVGAVIGRHKVGKYFTLTIDEDRFVYARKEERIAQDRALDGMYVIRTNVPQAAMGSEAAVSAYKCLSLVEQAFRCLKHLDLEVEPIGHRLPHRVEAHVFLCMLGYYVEWHMRRALAPLLFQDDDKETAETLRTSIVAPARRSPKTLRKVQRRRTEDNLPVHSFETLLQDLNTLAKNRVVLKGQNPSPFDQYTVPSSLHRRAFELLNVSYPL